MFSAIEDAFTARMAGLISFLYIYLRIYIPIHILMRNLLVLQQDFLRPKCRRSVVAVCIATQFRPRVVLRFSIHHAPIGHPACSRDGTAHHHHGVARTWCNGVPVVGGHRTTR